MQSALRSSLRSFVATAAAQISSAKLHRFLYWSVIVATTTVGTTTSDYLTAHGWARLSQGVGLALRDGAGGAGDLVFRYGLGQCEPHHQPQSGDVLLVDDSNFEHARDCIGRLPGRHVWARLRGRRVGLWRSVGAHRGLILLHEYFARRALLGGLHPHAAARRHPG